MNTHFVSLTTSTLGGDMGVLSFAAGSSSCELMILNLKRMLNMDFQDYAFACACVFHLVPIILRYNFVFWNNWFDWNHLV